MMVSSGVMGTGCVSCLGCTGGVSVTDVAGASRPPQELSSSNTDPVINKVRSIFIAARSFRIRRQAVSILIYQYITEFVIWERVYL